VVKVNRKTITELGFQVMPGDFVTVKGDPIYPQRDNIYILLNKPKDVITTTNDEYDRRTILDIVKKRSRIFPVGRLDRNTTGAILLTNDGELANRLTHPKYQVRRVYKVKLDHELTRETAQAIAEGVMVDGQLTAPCELVVSPTGYDKCSITLIEGRNHEVKKMFEAVGYTVRQLDRKVFADISTAGLNRGRYRHLTYEEVRDLKTMTGMY
jgi:23S rRNA pseudouridine2605 synthase